MIQIRLLAMIAAAIVPRNGATAAKSDLLKQTKRTELRALVGGRPPQQSAFFQRLLSALPKRGNKSDKNRQSRRRESKRRIRKQFREYFAKIAKEKQVAEEKIEHKDGQVSKDILKNLDNSPKWGANQILLTRLT